MTHPFTTLVPLPCASQWLRAPLPSRGSVSREGNGLLSSLLVSK